jgi:hypothetical protein
MPSARLFCTVCDIILRLFCCQGGGGRVKGGIKCISPPDMAASVAELAKRQTQYLKVARSKPHPCTLIQTHASSQAVRESDEELYIINITFVKKVFKTIFLYISRIQSIFRSWPVTDYLVLAHHLSVKLVSTACKSTPVATYLVPPLPKVSLNVT